MLVKKIETLDPRWQPSVDLRGILFGREVISYAKVAGVTCPVEFSSKQEQECPKNDNWLSVEVHSRGRSRSRNRSDNICDDTKLGVSHGYRARSKSPMFRTQDSSKLNIGNIRSRSKSPLPLQTFPRKQESEALKMSELTVSSPRTRSKSPIYIPGTSASFSDVVRGCSRNNSRAPSIEDLTVTESSVRLKDTVISSLKSSLKESLPVKALPTCDVVINVTEEQHEVKPEVAKTEHTVTEKKPQDMNQSRSRSRSPLLVSGKSIAYSKVIQLGKENEKSQIGESSVQREVVTRGRSPTRRKPPKFKSDVSVKPDKLIPSIDMKMSNDGESSADLKSTLAPPGKMRTRSKSPIFVPGESASYSDILKGASSRNNSPSVSSSREHQNKSFSSANEDAGTFYSLLKREVVTHENFNKTKPLLVKEKELPMPRDCVASPSLNKNDVNKNSEKLIGKVLKKNEVDTVKESDVVVTLPVESTPEKSLMTLKDQSITSETIVSTENLEKPEVLSTSDNEPIKELIHKHQDVPFSEGSVCLGHGFSMKRANINNVYSDFMDTPISFIASGQQLMDSGLGTYHPDDIFTPIPIMTAISNQNESSGECLTDIKDEDSKDTVIKSSNISGKKKKQKKVISGGSTGSYGNEEPATSIDKSSKEETLISSLSSETSTTKPVTDSTSKEDNEEVLDEPVKTDIKVNKNVSDSNIANEDKDVSIPSSYQSFEQLVVSSHKMSANEEFIEIKHKRGSKKNKKMDSDVKTVISETTNIAQVSEPADMIHDVSTKDSSEDFLIETTMKAKRNSKKKKSVRQLKDAGVEPDSENVREEINDIPDISQVKTKRGSKKKKNMDSEQDISQSLDPFVKPEEDSLMESITSPVLPKRNSKKKKHTQLEVSKNVIISQEESINTLSLSSEKTIDEKEIATVKPKRRSTKKRNVKTDHDTQIETPDSDNFNDTIEKLVKADDCTIEGQSELLTPLKVKRDSKKKKTPASDKDTIVTHAAPSETIDGNCSTEPTGIVDQQLEEINTEPVVTSNIKRRSKKKRSVASSKDAINTQILLKDHTEEINRRTEELVEPADNSVDIAISSEIQVLSEMTSCVLECSDDVKYASLPNNENDVIIAEHNEHPVTFMTTADVGMLDSDLTLPFAVKMIESTGSTELCDHIVGDNRHLVMLEEKSSEQSLGELNPASKNLITKELCEATSGDMVVSDVGVSHVVTPDVPETSTKSKKNSKKKKSSKSDVDTLTRSMPLMSASNSSIMVDPPLPTDLKHSVKEEVVLPENNSNSNVDESSLGLQTIKNKSSEKQLLIKEKPKSKNKNKLSEHSVDQSLCIDQRSESLYSVGLDNTNLNSSEVESDEALKKACKPFDETDISACSILPESYADTSVTHLLNVEKGNNEISHNTNEKSQLFKDEIIALSTEENLGKEAEEGQNLTELSIVMKESSSFDDSLISTVDSDIVQLQGSEGSMETLMENKDEFRPQVLGKQIKVEDQTSLIITKEETVTKTEIQSVAEDGNFLATPTPLSRKRSKKKRSKAESNKLVIASGSISDDKIESSENTPFIPTLSPAQPSSDNLETQSQEGLGHVLPDVDKINKLSKKNKDKKKKSKVEKPIKTNENILTEYDQVSENETANNNNPPQFKRDRVLADFSNTSESKSDNSEVADMTRVLQNFDFSKYADKENRESLPENEVAPLVGYPIKKDKRVIEFGPLTSLLFENKTSSNDSTKSPNQKIAVEMCEGQTDVILDKSEVIEPLECSLIPSYKNDVDSSKPSMLVISSVPVENVENKDNLVQPSFSENKNIAGSSETEDDNFEISPLLSEDDISLTIKKDINEGLTNFAQTVQETENVPGPDSLDDDDFIIPPLLSDDVTTSLNVAKHRNEDLKNYAEPADSTSLVSSVPCENVSVAESDNVDGDDFVIPPLLSDDCITSLYIKRESKDTLTNFAGSPVGGLEVCSEIKDAIKIHPLLSNEDFNPIDITKINTESGGCLKSDHVLTGDFPEENRTKPTSESDDDFDMPPLLCDEDLTFSNITKPTEDSKMLLESERTYTLSSLPVVEDVITEELRKSDDVDDNSIILDDILNKSLDALLSDDNNLEVESAGSPGALNTCAPVGDASPSFQKLSDPTSSLSSESSSQLLSSVSFSVEEENNYSSHIQNVSSDFGSHTSSLPGSSIIINTTNYIVKDDSISADLSSTIKDNCKALPLNRNKEESDSLKDLCKNISLEIDSYGLKKPCYSKNESSWLQSSLMFTSVAEKPVRDTHSSQIWLSDKFSDWNEPLKASSVKKDESEIWMSGEESTEAKSVGFEDSFDISVEQSFVPESEKIFTDNLLPSNVDGNYASQTEISTSATTPLDESTDLSPSEPPQVYKQPLPADYKIESSLLEKQKYTESETEVIRALIELNKVPLDSRYVHPSSSAPESLVLQQVEGKRSPTEEFITVVASQETKVFSDSIPTIAVTEEPVNIEVKTITEFDAGDSSETSDKPASRPRITRTPDVAVESFETTETEDTTESTQEQPRGSFDTISSRDMSQDQSVDDILVEIKGTVEDVHPSSVELSANISISTSEGKVSREMSESKFTRVQRIIQTRKRIIRKTVIVNGVEKTIEEVVDEPEVINESIQEGGFSGSQMIREESSDDSRSVSSEVMSKGFRRSVIDGKEVLETFGDEGPVITEVVENVDGKPSKLRTTIIDQPTATISRDSDDSVKDHNVVSDESSSTTSRLEYSSAEIDIPLSGDIIIHPERPESFTQQYSNVSSREFVTTLHSSMRTSVKRVRRVIRKVIIKDGKEEIVEEVVDEPEEVEVQETSPRVASFEHSQGTSNLVQIVNVPEGKDIDYSVCESGNVMTSVHSITRTINKVLRKVQIIDGKEVVTEELIQDPSEQHTTEVDSPSVTVSHRLDQTEDGKLSDSPDVVVNVSSWNQRSQENKQSVHEQIQEKVRELRGFDESSQTIQSSSSKTRVIRKVVIIGDQEMKEELSEPTVEITEVSSDLNSDETCVGPSKPDKVVGETDFISHEQEHTTKLLASEPDHDEKTGKSKKDKKDRRKKIKDEPEHQKSKETKSKSKKLEKPSNEKHVVELVESVKTEQPVDLVEVKPSEDGIATVQIEGSITVSKEYKQKSKPASEPKEKSPPSETPSKRKSEQSEIPSEVKPSDNTKVEKTLDFISMERGHTSDLLHDPCSPMKSATDVLKTVITSVEPVEEEVKKTKGKKSKDKSRRSTSQPNQTSQEKPQPKAQENLEESKEPKKEVLPQIQVLSKTAVEVSQMEHKEKSEKDEATSETSPEPDDSHQGVPAVSEQVDLKTGKIRKSKKKRPSVKDVFSSFEKDEETVTAKIDRSESPVKVTTDVSRKSTPPPGEVKISPDREMKIDRPSKSKKQNGEKGKKMIESPDYRVEVETAVKDEAPKVELSVRVNEKGVPVVEVFTTGGMEEKVVDEPCIDNRQVAQDIPLQIPKDQVEPKKKTKKKRDKGTPVLTESSSIEDSIEPDVSKKQTKREVEEPTLTKVCKSPDSTSEDDISKRTIKKAKRKLPQVKTGGSMEISPLASPSAVIDAAFVPVCTESSIPVMASFPDEPETTKDETSKMIEIEKSRGDGDGEPSRTDLVKGVVQKASETVVAPENILAEKKKKKTKDSKGKTKKPSDPHVKISATLSSDTVESSSNVEYVISRDEPNSVSLAIQHSDDTVNVSVTTGANEPEIKEQSGDMVTRVNVSIGRTHSPQRVTDFIDSERGHSNALLYTEKTPQSKKTVDSLIKTGITPDTEKPERPCAPESQAEAVEHVSSKVLNLKSPPAMYQVMLGDISDVYDVNIINNNLNKMKETKNEEEVKEIIVSTIITITEYLEIITYKIYSTKRTTLMSDEEKLVKLEKLKKDLINLKESAEQCSKESKSEELLKATEAVIKGVSDTVETLDNAHSHLRLTIATSEEFLNGVNNVTVLLNGLSEDLVKLSRDQVTPTVTKLEKLYECEEENEEYLKEVVRLRRVGGEVEDALEVGLKNRSIAAHLRDRLEQDLALALEYRDTLAELEQVTAMASNIVNSRPVVNSLEHLQAELQKDRKFFANLTRCRALLESLESHLDEDTRSSHSNLHRDLHRKATQILERASSRAEAMAQTASKWTLLEGKLKEEKAWLTVAAQRVPGLAGVTSADYEQYISLYQTLSVDIIVHSSCIWRWLCIAHSLQDLVTCRPLEDSCEHLREVICDLESRVSSDLTRLTAFKQVWTRYESLQDRVEHWLNQVERNDRLHQPTTNIVNFWELKAEYEVYKEVKNEAGLEFETAVRTLPISDEQSERVNRSRSAERWAKLEAVLASLQESVESQGGSCSESLDMADKQLEAVKALLDRLESVTPADAEQLSLHTEQLQVVKGSVERICGELGRLGPVPCELADRVGRAQGNGRSLQARSFKLLTTHRDTEARLGKLSKAIARLNQHHSKAGTILEQAIKCKDVDYDHLMQALEKAQNVVTKLEEDRRLLDRVQSWVVDVSERCPGLADSLTSEVSKLALNQQTLENLAKGTLDQLTEQAQLWDHYIAKRDGLKSSLRQANYMMELLTIRGNVDYQHLVKTTNRLNGVAETLGKVEGGEVWTAAEELKARLCGPEAQALEAEVQGLQAELASTSRQLEAMCTKYRKAAELWASARTLQEQIASSLEQTVATLHNPLPSLAQALPTVTDEEKAKLKELEELAEGIADQIGVERERLLGKQVDNLTQRLKDVESTLEELSQIQRLADQPTSNGDSIQTDSVATKELLESSDEGTVDRLVELRDHLITLGKSQPNYESSISTVCTPSDQTLRHKLQRWEELFRSTFQEYHRVSSKLASTGEANTLVKLWRDYLDQVNAFLTTPLPDEYQSLTYHTSLCQAHQNVLGSQHSIIEKKRTSSDKVDKELIEEFNTLTNLHNETLAKIIERQQQVACRVSCWERYREEKNRLLSWLREMETTRNKLNLRYLKIKTVPVTLLNIQDLLDKIPEGENQEKLLRDHLKKILDFTEDESLAKSLRMDQATIAQRITNMAAALQTWKGYMVRVNEYIDSFESETTKLSSTLCDIKSKIPESEPPDITQKEIKERLLTLKDLLLRVSSANDSLSSINETEDRLKEYISPVDAKGVCQRVWVLRQQTIDLERNIELHIQMLEEKLQLAHIYDKREKKFLDWVKSVEERLEGGMDRPGSLSNEAEDELTRLEAEVEAEIVMRKAEVEWLVTTGESLRRMSPEPSSDQGSAVENAWARIQQATQFRSNKVRALIQSMSKLEIRFEELRIWLEMMEAKLAQPFIIKSSKKEEISRLMTQQESIQNEIQKQSSNVADILNMCEIILNDCETCHVSLETPGITSAMENIEKRWKGVCVKSAELKQNLKNIWGLIQQLIGLHKKQETWLKQQKTRFQKLEHKVATTGHSDLPTLASNLQKLESDVSSGSQGLGLVEELYSKVASSACVDVEVTKPLSDLLTLWYQLKRDISNTSSDVQATIDKLNRFNEAQSECVVGLSAVDALLAIVEAGRAGSPSERSGTLAAGTELDRAKSETSRLSSVVTRADTAADLLMESSNQEDRTRIESLVSEYKQLWDSVQDRIDRLSRQMVNRSCLVDTLKFEVDACTQVNTLESEVIQKRSGYDSNEPSPGSVTRQQAYLAELDSTMGELARLLDQLETTKHSSSLQLNKLLGGCQSTLELVRHLSQSLMNECGLTENESRVPQVNTLEERFNSLQAKSRDRDQLTSSSVSGRLTCPLCSAKNWKQFDNDIWRLEQWLQYAEGFFTSQPSVLPSSIELLEDIIQDHREVMLDLDSHHRLVLSLNIIGNHLAEHTDDEDKAEVLRKRLSAANTRWEEVCSTAARWHTKLHQALMQNDEFHDNMSSLVEWLERTEVTIKESEPVDLTDPTPVIQAKYNRFRELRGELERCEPRVRSLEEAASEVFRGQGNRSTVERLASIRLRLQSLSRLVSVYVLKLGAVLGDDPANLLPLSQPSLDTLSQQLLDNAAAAPTSDEAHDGVDTGPLVRSCRFFGRVVRASLPISALLLLVLGATTLVPVTQEDYSCTLANTLLTSFTPVLRYPYGRPPI